MNFNLVEKEKRKFSPTKVWSNLKITFHTVRLDSGVLLKVCRWEGEG